MIAIAIPPLILPSGDKDGPGALDCTEKPCNHSAHHHRAERPEKGTMQARLAFRGRKGGRPYEALGVLQSGYTNRTAPESLKTLWAKALLERRGASAKNPAIRRKVSLPTNQNVIKFATGADLLIDEAAMAGPKWRRQKQRRQRQLSAFSSTTRRHK